jgi:hypothetical protein
MIKPGHFEIELLEHNGVYSKDGAKVVQPFAGMVLPAGPYNMNCDPVADFHEQMIVFDGRSFTYSHTVDFPTNGYHCFRERLPIKAPRHEKLNLRVSA